MSDQDGTGLPAGSARTGVPAVDDVLTSVESLDDRPLDEHAAVFERAHEHLRRALDTVDPTPADGPDGPDGLEAHGR